jgi:DnaJ-class molecular chaperone
MDKNYYQILELSPNSSSEEIRKAYKEKALKCHPDKNGGNTEQFQEVMEAYQKLMANEEDDFNVFIFDIFKQTENEFKTIFNNMVNREDKTFIKFMNASEEVSKNKILSKGEDVICHVPIDFESLYYNKPKKIVIKRKRYGNDDIKSFYLSSLLEKEFYFPEEGDVLSSDQIPGDLYVKIIPEADERYKIMENGDIKIVHTISFDDFTKKSKFSIPFLKENLSLNLKKPLSKVVAKGKKSFIINNPIRIPLLFKGKNVIIDFKIIFSS